MLHITKPTTNPGYDIVFVPYSYAQIFDLHDVP